MIKVRWTCFIVLIALTNAFYLINGNRIQRLNKIEDHINAKKHDSTIDHEAFLGLDESKKYENLTEEESKMRLKKLIKAKVDINKDDFVSEEELRQWIKHISMLMNENERDKMWKRLTNSSDGLLDYDVYLKGTYDVISVDDLDDLSKANLAKMKLQDLRKWKMVDENNDNKLDENEFLIFLHPEDYPKMKSLVVQEALEISDRNKDGYIDMAEYINDIWPPDGDVETPDQDTVIAEQDNFRNQRDVNKDGKLDAEEIGEWLMPTDYDPADAETQHLMQHADSDKDGRLSMEEIIESHDIFVGSQATNYGQTLKHDEL